MNVDMTIGLPPDEDSPTGASSVYGSLPPRVLGYGAPGLDREKAQRAAMVRSLREPGPGVRLMYATCVGSLIALLALVHTKTSALDRVKVFEASIYVGYVGAHVVLLFLLTVRGTATVEPIVGVGLVLRLLFSFVLWFLEPVPQVDNRLACRLREAFEQRNSALLTAIPAAFYGASDLILQTVERRMSVPPTFLASFRAPLVGFVWSVTFVQLSCAKWAGLLALGVGTALHSGAYYVVLSGGPLRDMTWCAVGLAGVLLSAFGGVSNEYLLRTQPGSLNFQNVAFFGVLFLLMLVNDGSNAAVLYAGQLSALDWIAALVFGALGVVASHLLKSLGCVWREVAQGMILVLDGMVIPLTFGGPLPAVRLVGLVVVALGTTVCVVDRGVFLAGEHLPAPATMKGAFL